MDVKETLKKAIYVCAGAAALAVEAGAAGVEILAEKGEKAVEKGKALKEEMDLKAKEEKKKDINEFVSSLSDEEKETLKKELFEEQENTTDAE